MGTKKNLRVSCFLNEDEMMDCLILAKYFGMDIKTFAYCRIMDKIDSQKLAEAKENLKL